jgi:hypothetical protein
MPENKLTRFFIGLALSLAVLAAGFAIALSVAPTWGATPEEAGRVLPGDEINARPVVAWTNAITINAPPAQVWPWIAQLGDRRGGFYSYTFIENLATQTSLYRNASQVVPVLQNPQPGEGMIFDLIQIYRVSPGQYLLANAPTSSGMGWSWLWTISPLEGGKTRLVVRFRIQPSPGTGSPLLTYGLSAAAFVMEHASVIGLKERAEGSPAPGPNEPWEIGAWLAALLAGIVAMVFYMSQRRWLPPLLVGLAALVALLVFTFVQPAIWLRAAADLALVAGLVWSRIKR